MEKVHSEYGQRGCPLSLAFDVNDPEDGKVDVAAAKSQCCESSVIKVWSQLYACLLFMITGRAATHELCEIREITGSQTRQFNVGVV